MIRSRAMVLSICTALTFAAGAWPAAAQPFERGGHGMMMGPHIIGPGFGRMCGPGAAGFVAWRIDRLGSDLKLTDAQRASFDTFKAAADKATDTLRASCATDTAATLPARMEAMERRMAAMAEAIGSMRPALDAFYASLTDEQKARLDSRHDRSRFWHWRDRW